MSLISQLSCSYNLLRILTKYKLAVRKLIGVLIKMEKENMKASSKHRKSILNKDLAKLICDQRTLQNLSLKELTKLTQIKSTSTLADYEAAKKPIPLSDLYAIANVLNISPLKILKFVNNKE